MLDYGAGNLASVRQALEYLGCEVLTMTRGDGLARAERIVLPGVGNFSSTARLDERSLSGPAVDAIARGVPFLGICVGLQWFFDGSEEAPAAPGASLFTGTCTRLPDTVKVPHVGWNTLHNITSDWLLRGISADAHFYFTHSYAAPIVEQTAAATTHGRPFTSAIERGNLAGVQFHPEKSGDAGLQVLRNFLDLPC